MEHIERYRDDFPIEGTHYMVEQYVDSLEEVSVEVLCHEDRRQTLAVTEKFLSEPPMFAEVGHLVACHRTNDTALTALAEKACEALGIDRGIAHVEVKFDSKGAPWLIEAAARPGGDGIMDQVERAYGYNPYTLHVASWLRDRPVPHGGERAHPQQRRGLPEGAAREITSLRFPKNFPRAWSPSTSPRSLAMSEARRGLVNAGRRDRDGVGRDLHRAHAAARRDRGITLRRDLRLIRD